MVQEPPQPKIKIKRSQGQETPSSVHSGKVTIQVGGSRGSAAASPAPATGRSGESHQGDGVNGVSSLRSTAGQSAIAAQSVQLEKTRSISASGASPSPSIAAVKQEATHQPSPAAAGQANGPTSTPSGQPNGGAATQQNPGATPLQNGYHLPPAQPVSTLYSGKYRPPGQGKFPAVPSVFVS